MANKDRHTRPHRATLWKLHHVASALVQELDNNARQSHEDELVAQVYAFMCSDSTCDWWMSRDDVDEDDLNRAALNAAAALKTMANLGTLADERHAQALCRTMARRMFFDVIRRTKRRAELRLMLPQLVATLPQAEVGECLRWAVSQLGKDSQIRAAVLHQVLGCTFQEILLFEGEESNLTTDALRKRAKRGLEKLWQQFNDSAGGDDA